MRMGTFDLKAGVLTSTINYAPVFQGANAPVLRLGQTLVLLPCGSKLGWQDDRTHREMLSLIESLGGRVVTVESEIARATVDAPADDASWLIMQFVDDDARVDDPDHEAIIHLPINWFRLMLTLSDTYPADAAYCCVVQLPAGLSMEGAEWFGRMIPDAD